MPWKSRKPFKASWQRGLIVCNRSINKRFNARRSSAGFFSSGYWLTYITQTVRAWTIHCANCNAESSFNHAINRRQKPQGLKKTNTSLSTLSLTTSPITRFFWPDVKNCIDGLRKQLRRCFRIGLRNFPRRWAITLREQRRRSRRLSISGVRLRARKRPSLMRKHSDSTNPQFDRSHSRKIQNYAKRGLT